MSRVYLYKYNNYVNRMCKYESTISGYDSAGTRLDDYDTINFNTNDDVNTTIILNSDVEADYMVVTDDSGVITSRWYILDRTRTLQTQYRYTLHRDVMAEYQTAVLNSVAFMRRGIVPRTSPFIFNSEGNSYNQIKTSEGLIKDETGVPWIVGYCDENLFGDPQADLYLPIVSSQAYSETAESVEELLERYPGSSTSDNPIINDSYVSMCNWTFNGRTQNAFFNVTVDNPGGTDTLIFRQRTNDNGSTIYITDQTFTTYLPAHWPGNDERCQLVTDELGRGNKAAYNYIYANRNKIVKVGTSPNAKYYKLIFSTQAAEHGEYTVGIDNQAVQQALVANIESGSHPWDVGYIHPLQSKVDSTAYNKFCTVLQDAVDLGYCYLDPANTYPILNVKYTMQRYKAVWSEMTTDLTRINHNMEKNRTAPLYMFCIPYRACSYTAPGGSSGTTDSNGAKYAARMIKELGSHVYDVQVVPYFPDRTRVVSGGVNLSGVNSANVSLISGPSSTLNFIYWSPVSEFSFTAVASGLGQWNYGSGYDYPVKVQNETQFLRLNSPNYASSFDMSIAKNNGITSWKIRGKYKPYQPYIHVRPTWGGLYGNEVEDARGMICAGDFSMDLINNAWIDYQINNKNYNLIFNRDIQSLDVQQQVARQEQAINAITNGISATVGGAVSGGIAGGVGGAIAGGLVAGVGSAVGAAIDWSNQELLRNDARSAAIDKWGYNLGNIKARPTALTKVSAINPDNKLFPFYEIFEASAAEMQNLDKQIKYNSMRLDIIGSPKDYREGGGVYTFLRGEIIRIDLPDANDTHTAAEIKREFEGGWYFYYD